MGTVRSPEEPEEEAIRLMASSGKRKGATRRMQSNGEVGPKAPQRRPKKKAADGGEGRVE